jgi:hypothetical protein
VSATRDRCRRLRVGLVLPVPGTEPHERGYLEGHQLLHRFHDGHQLL